MRTSLAVLVVLCAWLGSGCGCTTVEPGNVGIKVSLGSVEGPALKEGFHWISVLADVTEMTTRTQTYTMAGAGTEGQSDGAVNVLARDQLAV